MESEVCVGVKDEGFVVLFIKIGNIEGVEVLGRRKRRE